LAEHKDEIDVVERAWNYARRVAYINSGKHSSPAELMEIKENDYEVLKTFLAPTYDEKGQAASGTAELARQLSKRSGNEVSQPTVLAHMRIVFLSQVFLDRIETGLADELAFGFAREVSRLYKTPELMRQVEQEVLDGKITKVSEVEGRVNQYLAELDNTLNIVRNC